MDKQLNELRWAQFAQEGENKHVWADYISPSDDLGISITERWFLVRVSSSCPDGKVVLVNSYRGKVDRNEIWPALIPRATKAYCGKMRSYVEVTTQIGKDELDMITTPTGFTAYAEKVATVAQTIVKEGGGIFNRVIEFCAKHPIKTAIIFWLIGKLCGASKQK